MYIKKILFIILISTIVFLTGCWDSIEINERIFVTAVGLDLNTDPNLEGRYVVTYVYPNIGALGKNPSQKEVKIIKSTTAISVFDGSRQLTTRVQDPIYLKHLKVFVIGEELFKNPNLIKEYFDGVARDPRMNRKIGIVVAQGSAKDVLSTKVEELAIIGGYLNNMLNNDKVAARFTKQTFSGMMKDFQFSRASLAPRAVPKEDEYKLSGAAILKDYKLIGWIGEKENRAIAIAKGDFKSDIIDVKCNDTIATYVITDYKSNKDVTREKDELKVNLNISLEGYLQQYKLGKDISVFNTKFINAFEEEIQKNIEKDIHNVASKLQNEYNADVLGIGEYLCKFQPDIWEEVKDEWDDIFPNIDIKVNVIAKVRRTGLTK